MLLSEFTDGGAAVEIDSLAYDSRSVVPGALFFCVVGGRRDGHDHAGEALAKGAVALVVERPLGLGVPEVLVASVRKAMGPIAARFHGDPSERLAVVGVTGTNGKTTTTFIVRALLEAAGLHTGLLGTVKAVIGGVVHEAIRTTPEAVDLQASFRAMLEGGDAACAIEISSHALALHRVDGTRLAAAVFTNLTQDHLDFHGSMEEYFAAKRRLFDLGTALAVINIDDPYGRRLAAERPRGLRTFALDRPADYTARDVRLDLSGARFVLHAVDREIALVTALPGRFNVANTLAAIAAVHGLGVSLDAIADALPGVEAAPGRFQAIDEGQPFSVLVDYAHTPDSLENVLLAARALGGGRVWCVFGCGGDRDRGKRPQMGRIAAQLADVTVVTSDNPRSESPQRIVAEILAGAAGGEVEAIVDRSEAITSAIARAEPGDVVLVAGKGHEQGQEFEAGRTVPFDDATVVRGALRAARRSAS